MTSWTEITDPLPLTEPDRPTDLMRGHDGRFISTAKTFDTVRNAINEGLDFINSCLDKAGLDKLPKLPTESLDTYIVYPLTGDYLRIQQNAAACHTFKGAMNTWGHNFEIVAANQVISIGGRTGLSLASQMIVYDAAVRAAGVVVDKGAVVFDGIAKVSEKVAIRVEKLFVELGEALLRLSKKVVRYGRGWFGAVTLVADLIDKGIEAITGIWDDLMLVIDTIKLAFSFKDKVTEWANTQVERIKAFEEILRIFEELPGVNLDIPLEQAPPIDTGAIVERMKDVLPDFGKDGGPEEDDLLGGLDGALGDAGYEEPYYDPDCDPSNGTPANPIDPGNHPIGWTPENGSPGWMITTTTADDPVKAR